MGDGAHLLTWEGGIPSIVFFLCGFCFPKSAYGPFMSTEGKSLSLCSFPQFTLAVLTTLPLKGSSQLPSAIPEHTASGRACQCSPEKNKSFSPVFGLLNPE